MISIGEFILLSLIVVSAVLATVYLNRKLKEKGYRVNNLLNVLSVLTVSTALCLVGTLVAWILKGVAFALILLYASVEDFTKREADDCLWVMILLLCITNASGLSLWSMLGGGIIAFVPTLAMTIVCKNGFGGADIKLAGASGRMLGFMGGSIGYLIGLLFAVVFNLIYNKVKGRSNEIAFPMLPFLSCGLMLGYMPSRRIGQKMS